VTSVCVGWINKPTLAEVASPANHWRRDAVNSTVDDEIVPERMCDSCKKIASVENQLVIFVITRI